MKPKNNGTEIERAHSVYAPSASQRWINCPGSIALIPQFPEPEDSDSSREGTAAHELCEIALTEGKDATEYMGREFNGFKCDTEMAESVQVYLDAARTRFPEGELSYLLNKLVFVEQRFDMGWLHPGVFGKSDAVIYDVTNRVLRVLDYKNGVNVVDPEWNSQLMIYGLGALHFIWSKQTEITKKAISVLQMVDTVELVIVQPNGLNMSEDDYVRTWEISASDLIYWGVHILKSAIAATLQENAPLRAGKHCKYCPAIAGCPAHAANALAVARTEFDNPILPPPSEMTPEQIVKVMDLSSAFKDWADAVKAYAQYQMELGVQLPGYKLVQKKSNRKWKDELDAAARLSQILGENAYKKKLLSVAQAEDALKLIKVKPQELNSYWVKPDTGLSIAPESDKRPALAAPGAMDFLHDAEWAK